MRFNSIVLAALTLFPVVAQNSSSHADVQLQKAIRKETVDGDLKGAIELYRKLAANSADAGLAAQALLRLAECHEAGLGRGEAGL